MENHLSPVQDPNISSVKYVRTLNQDMALGLQPREEDFRDGIIEDNQPGYKNIMSAPWVGGRGLAIKGGVGGGEGGSEGERGIIARTKGGQGKDDDNDPTLPPAESYIGCKEVLRFPSDYPHCTKPAETDMCVTDIPHSKEVVIVPLTCKECRYRSNNIKRGGGIPRFGSKVTLRVTT